MYTPTQSDDDRHTHAGGVVYRLNSTTPELLLVTARRNPADWVLPKGHIETGETPDQAAVREVFEEAGVTARIVDFLTTSRQVGRGQMQVIAYYLMEMVAEGGRGEGRRIDWLSAAAAIRRARYEDSRAVLRHAGARLAERFSP